jgi:hemoglobin-like flavoprotein
MHWPMVGLALFHTLKVLGEKFTPEVKDAWTILFNFLGFHMIEGLLAHSHGGR